MSLAKRGMLITLTYIALALLLISCATPKLPTDQNPIQKEEVDNVETSIWPETGYQPKEGEVVGYYLDKGDFREFLQKPSVELLFSKQINWGVYNKIPHKEGYIQQRIFATDKIGPVHYDEAKSGLFRIASWPVYTEFIDFMNDADSFKQILLERGIDEEIVYYTIITHRYSDPPNTEPVPPGTQYNKMCIWIHTDFGDYFLEDNPYLAEDPNDPAFTYDFHDLAGYSKKYGEN